MISYRRLFVLMACSGFLTACGAEKPRDVAPVISKNLTKNMQMPKIDEVKSTPIQGLYEVRIGNQVFYSDSKGEYLVSGQIIDTVNKKNLTQERLSDINRIDFHSLPLQDAVIWKKGTGERKLVVFADPNCGYCKHFESNLQQLDNITVYTFVFPVPIGESSEALSRAIACSASPIEAWRSWMLTGQKPEAAPESCDSKVVDRNIALAQKLEVNSTPTLVLSNGARVMGAIPPDELEKKLIEASQASSDVKPSTPSTPSRPQFNHQR